jgi:hypothetical protein
VLLGATLPKSGSQDSYYHGHAAWASVNATAVAINQCRDGNPRPAIPELEQKLRDNNIAVPARS